VVGNLGNVHLERRFNNQDLGIESADMPESAAACPESGSSVWYFDCRGSTLKWSFRIHTAARELDPRISPCRGTEGGFSRVKEDRGRMRVLAWPAGPIRL